MTQNTDYEICEAFVIVSREETEYTTDFCLGDLSEELLDISESY